MLAVSLCTLNQIKPENCMRSTVTTWTLRPVYVWCVKLNISLRKGCDVWLLTHVQRFKPICFIQKHLIYFSVNSSHYAFSYRCSSNQSPSKTSFDCVFSLLAAACCIVGFTWVKWQHQWREYLHPTLYLCVSGSPWRRRAEQQLNCFPFDPSTLECPETVFQCPSIYYF